MAVGVNPVDWKIREGRHKDRFPTFFPIIPGWDVAGVVERVGPAVWEFAVGDEVVGYVRKDFVQEGTYAELVSAPVRTLTRRPMAVSWAESAGLPLAGLTAYQAMNRALRVSEEDVVLVQAAAGGVGHLAVQLAREAGARVIGTASERNHDFLRSLGAEPVAYGDGLVDRVRELAPDGVEVVFDTVGGEALRTVPKLLRDGGRVASLIDPVGVRELGGRYLFVRSAPVDLAALVQHAQDGRLRVEVTRTYPLAEAAQAHRDGQQGHTRGKLVLEVG
jgi:NADPH:quinone reductase-like Zn-dependent oxidoreductase